MNYPPTPPVSFCRSLRDLISSSISGSAGTSRSNSPTPEGGAEGLACDVTGGEHLIALPKIFAQALYKLNLSSNHLQAVPPSICDLTELSILNLSQ